MYVSILGRQPALGLAELESLYGGGAVRPFGTHYATVDSTIPPNITRLGGSLKLGTVVLTLQRASLRDVTQKITPYYLKKWLAMDTKITLGISAYGFDASPKEVQAVGLSLKQKTKGRLSLRLVPNQEATLSTATSHHNKLGLSAHKIELLIIRDRDGTVLVAESLGAQNITAYARRDQGRPKRDAFVGMLPPKLALTMVNLAVGASNKRLAPAATSSTDTTARGESRALGGGAVVVNSFHDKAEGLAPPVILDPFCGTGVLLQEAALLGYSVYGTDLSEKMIDYSRENLDWLARTHHLDVTAQVHSGDAMTTQWQTPIDAVACETYLGQPFSAPPSPAKLTEVRGNCNHIISTFLTNIGRQLRPGTPLCVAVPAWRDASGTVTHLPLTRSLSVLGYRQKKFTNLSTGELLYFREDQVVARELLVLEKL